MKEGVDKSYFESLDALRFFAFLSVFLAHCGIFFGFKFENKYVEILHKHFFLNGSLGVNFFFVLSGFLITWLLCIERDKNEKINIRYFYMRRILRIWPVYFLVVAVGFIIGTHDIGLLNDLNFRYHINSNQLKWYLLFLANYDLIINGIVSLLLCVLWSVAVEEQFYVIWPIIFYVFGKKSLPYICYTIIIISFISRFYHEGLSCFSTLEVMSDLAIGGLIAYYSMYKKSFINGIINISKKKIVMVYVIFFVIVPLRGFSFIFGEKIYTIYYCFESVVYSCIFGFIILEQNFSKHSFFKFGSIKVFGHLGKMSYGLYAYHMLFFPITFFAVNKIGMCENELKTYLFKIIFSLLLTITFGYLSFNYFEKKILYFKKYFQS